jgi:hypothetical protein
MEQDITIYLAKATESLLTAASEFANGWYNSCANRCYYACFQAAIAALLREGIRPRGQWSHAFVQAQLGGVLINQRKRYDPPLANVDGDDAGGDVQWHPYLYRCRYRYNNGCWGIRGHIRCGDADVCQHDLRLFIRAVDHNLSF